MGCVTLSSMPDVILILLRMLQVEEVAWDGSRPPPINLYSIPESKKLSVTAD